MHFTAAKPSSCFPNLFRRKNSARSQSFKVSHNERKKNSEEYIPSFAAANRSNSSSSSNSSSNNSSHGRNSVGGGSFLMFMELRKKITVFRDFFDVPSIGASAPIHELIIATAEDLHRMYPELIPNNPTAKLQERNTHQGLLCFYDVLNCIAESWIDDQTRRKMFNKPDIEGMPHHELLNLVVSMMECINKEAKSRFEMMEPKNDYSPRESTNIKRSKPHSGGTDYNSDNSRSSDSSSPHTPTSVLPDSPSYEELVGKLAVNISPPRLLDLRAQAVQRASPVDLKRLALHILPQLDEDSAQEVLDQTTVSTSAAKEEVKLNGNVVESPAGDESENFQKAKAKFEKIDEEIMKRGGFHQQGAIHVTRNKSLKSQHSAPPISLHEFTHELDTTTLPLPPSSFAKASAPARCNAPIPASSMTSTETRVPPLQSSAEPPPSQPQPPPPATTNYAQPSPSLPPLPTAAPTQPKRQQTGPPPSPPPPPPSPGDSPPRTDDYKNSPPQQPPRTAAKQPPPPPPGKGGGSSMPPPAPPGSNVNGGGCQPPPPPGCGKALQKGKSTKLKRSSHMGNLYRVLKGKVEGACSASKPSAPGNKRPVTSGVNAGGGNSMADALAEMTKRSAYFQQIEEDVMKHEKMIKELQRTLVSFQTKDLNDMLDFHKHVESRLEVLTDETQTLARFEGFPMKKLETLRMAAALYTKLKNIISDLQSWEIEPPLVQGLDKVEKYFSKIKTDMESMERTKDDEAKKFQNHNIHFDFSIITKIKEAMVDLSSDFMELALEESKEAKQNPSDQAGGKQQACAQMLWRAFQFAFKVYSFAGGQDERADNLTKELAKEIESVQTQE